MTKQKGMLKGIIASLLAVGLLAGCGSTGGDTNSGSTGTTDNGDKTIKFYWANIETSQQDVWQKYVFAPFLDKHPEIAIDAQYLPELQTR